MLEGHSFCHEWTESWYERYALIMLAEVASFKEVFKQVILSKNKTVAKSHELVVFYACLLGVIRFLEGISWGYSEMLMHQTLEKDHVLGV